MAVPCGVRHAEELSLRVSELSHALAGPLQVALGYLSLLEQDRQDDRSLHLAQAGVLRAAEMLPALERAMTAARPPVVERGDPVALLRDVLSTLGPTRTPELDVRGDALLDFDRRQLGQVFEAIVVDHDVASVVVGPVGGSWVLEATGGRRPDGAVRPLWELVVERHGGACRSTASSVGFWLPLPDEPPRFVAR